MGRRNKRSGNKCDSDKAHNVSNYELSESDVEYHEGFK